MSRSYFVYIMASKKHGVLYIGVTNDIYRRVWEHKQPGDKHFTHKYNVRTLVYAEETDDISAAITREKQLKKWNRAWKIRLIEQANPEWEDLYQP